MNAAVAFIIVPLASAFLLGLFGSRATWGGRAASLFTLGALVALGLWELAHPFDPQIVVLGGWKPPFGISLYVDSTILMLVVVLLALVLLAVAFQHENGQKRPLSFNVLALVLAASAAGILLTGDLFNLFVFLEIASAAAVALAAPPDASPRGVLRYWLFSSVASLAMLLGIAIVFSAAGMLNLVDLGLKWQAIAAPTRQVAGILILLGFLVKMEIAPFHPWAPETYHRASAPAGFMLSSVVATAAAVGLWKFFTLVVRSGIAADPLAGAFSFSQALFGLGMFSLVLGAAAMLFQKNVKKVLAFSTVSIMGLVLSAIAMGTPMAVKAAFFLLLANALGKGLLFWVTGRMAADHRTVDAQAWRQVPGKPASLVMAWFLGAACVIGLPMLPGFWGKIHFFGAAVSMGIWGKTGIALVIAATLAESIVILRIGHHLWEKPEENRDQAPACRFAPAYWLGILVFAAGIFWIGLAPAWFFRSVSHTQERFSGVGDHSVVMTTLSSFAPQAKPHIVEQR